MSITARSRSHMRLLIPFCMLLLFTLACGPRAPQVGTYSADPKDTPKQTETSLELKENGAGVWKIGEDEVAFSWYMKDDQLRVNTKGGGVIVGHFEKDVIRIGLPGSKEMTFKKVK